MTIRRPVALIIRDGWGENPNRDWDHANAIVQAATPVADRLTDAYPHTLIKTSGEDVGLPAGVMGNSEVGHQNIGAGRIVDQEVMRITRAIRDESFFDKPAIHGALEHIRKSGGRLHLLGLMSDGRVHSDISHAYAFLDLAKRNGLTGDQLAIHVITDGRDTTPNSGIGFVRQLQDEIDARGVGVIASVVGRFYAMDRDLRWERVQRAYELLTKGSSRTAPDVAAALQTYYDDPTEPSRGGDEFVEPTTIGDAPITVRPGDAVVFTNYRGDRPRELTKAFVLDDNQWASIDGGGFDRGQRLQDLYFATMAGYEAGLPTHVIFEKPDKMPEILGQYLAENGVRQMRCAETEKYPHVTFFFNDYREDPFAGEVQQEIPSPRDVSTYDQKPEMSAAGVTAAVVNVIENAEADFILVNYANGDMVGHTGDLAAAVKAVEVVDEGVGKILDAALARGGAVIVTADHGNCEQMTDPDSGRPHTAHTTYDVDLIIAAADLTAATLRPGGRLADVAPTVLALLGVEQPSAMTGGSLLDC